MGTLSKETRPINFGPAGTQGYTPANQLFFKDGQAYTRTGNISRENMDDLPGQRMKKMGVEPQPYKYQPFNFEVPKYEGYGAGKYGPAKKYGGSQNSYLPMGSNVSEDEYIKAIQAKRAKREGEARAAAMNARVKGVTQNSMHMKGGII